MVTMTVCQCVYIVIMAMDSESIPYLHGSCSLFVMLVVILTEMFAIRYVYVT